MKKDQKTTWHRIPAAWLTLCLATATTQAALLGRAALTPGGTDYQAYYDDVLNITWMTDANLVVSNKFGTTYGPYGRMSWQDAKSWIAAMNTSAYLGASGWRLPFAGPVSGEPDFGFSSDGSTDWGYNISAPGSAYPGATSNEMAHLFYNTLGNPGYQNNNGGNNPLCQQGAEICLINVSPFLNLRANEPTNLGNPGPSGVEYWSGSTGTSPSNSVYFSFREGYNDTITQANEYRAWAVHDGDPFSVVPVPAAVYLFGSALGLMGVMRGKLS